MSTFQVKLLIRCPRKECKSPFTDPTKTDGLSQYRRCRWCLHRFKIGREVPTPEEIAKEKQRAANKKKPEGNP